MATERDQVEYSQMFLNACVLLDGLCLMTDQIVTHYYSTGPSGSQSGGRGCVNPFISIVILVKPSSNSTQIPESRGRPSLGLSEQRVEVTGLCLLINLNSSMPR
jgi:hypothetical protein